MAKVVLSNDGALVTQRFLDEAPVSIGRATSCDIVVDDPLADGVVNTIAAAAHSGRIGDGKIWVTTVDTLVRVRTAERGVEAI